MTFLEKYRKETKWQLRIILMEMFHLHKQANNEKWKISETAGYFGVSKSLVSENLAIAKQLEQLDMCPSRKQALRKLKELNNVASIGQTGSDLLENV